MSRCCGTATRWPGRASRPRRWAGPCLRRWPVASVAAIVMVAASRAGGQDRTQPFSAPEYFALVFFGLASVVCLGGGSPVNAFISLFIGFLIASVGVDGTYGIERFSFGIDTLRDGIEYQLFRPGGKPRRRSWDRLLRDTSLAIDFAGKRLYVGPTPD